MARLGRLLLCLLIFHSTEFEDLDESHLLALTTTDLVADGSDHVSGHDMRTGLRNDHSGERPSRRHLPWTACSFAVTTSRQAWFQTDVVTTERSGGLEALAKGVLRGRRC
jgi:hypothetical protein